jgi:hypothetical protein
MCDFIYTLDSESGSDAEAQVRHVDASAVRGATHVSSSARPSGNSINSGRTIKSNSATKSALSKTKQKIDDDEDGEGLATLDPTFEFDVRGAGYLADSTYAGHSAFDVADEVRAGTKPVSITSLRQSLIFTILPSIPLFVLKLTAECFVFYSLDNRRPYPWTISSREGERS